MDAEDTLAESVTSSSDAVESERSTQDSTDSVPEEGAKEGRTFGGMTPSEAASLRWARVREREAAGIAEDEDADERTDRVTWVRVPVRTGAIIKRLADDAKKGNAQSARELRAWLTEVATDEENRVSDLDARTRRRVLDRLLVEIAEEDEAMPPEEGATPASGGTPAR